MRVKRTYFVTGAGRGLGLAVAEAVVDRGDVVVGTMRDPARAKGLLALAERAPKHVHIVTLDVCDADACAAMRASVQRLVSSVDVVVNNAGINSSSPDVKEPASARSLESLSASTMDAMWRTNALGPIWVTRALLPLLGDGARVVNVSSRRGSLHEKQNGGNYGYCMSKAALNMATRALASDLAGRGVVVVAVHPGSVKTAMAQPDAHMTPAEAAALMLSLITRIGGEHAGRFLDHTGDDRHW